VSTAFDPLPRGRHKLSSEEVLASQRERLLAAMLECVGEHGYAATTVPQVVARARVSRNGFYALFEDKAGCFLALCDQLGDELLSELYAHADRFEDGVHVYLRWWQDRPAFARAYLVELPSAGPRALMQRDRQLRAFEAMFTALGARTPLAARLLAHGITELVATEVREGRLDTLDGLHGELVALIRKVIV
jgi:AcrR family transcriptional regulator